MKKSIAIIHLLVIAAAWSSPWWLNWKIMCAAYVLYLLQNAVFGRCVLSLWQFKNSSESFYSHYLHKLKINLPEQYINAVADYVIPPLLIIASFLMHTL